MFQDPAHPLGGVGRRGLFTYHPLQLRFQSPYFLPILSSDRLSYQLIAHGFHMILLHQARHRIAMQVLLGPIFGGP